MNANQRNPLFSFTGRPDHGLHQDELKSVSHLIAPYCTLTWWCDLSYKGAMNIEHDEILSFRPTAKLEKALKVTQSKIENINLEFQDMNDDEQAWLHRCAMISTVGASTRIENAILTDAEIEWVDTALSEDGRPTAFEAQKEGILDKLSKDRERSLEEVVGCRELLSLIYLQGQDMFPLSETSLRGLHHALLRFYPAASHYAGSYKTSTNQVVSVNNETGERRLVLDPAPPGPQTDTAMRELVSWYNQSLKEHPWPLLVATEFVFRFLAIHPFQDGNGRLGRACFLMALLQADDLALNTVVRYISIDRQIERHRPLYYSVLQQASDGHYKNDPGDYQLEPLAWFVVRMLDAALEDISILREKYAALQRLSESANKVLACFRSSPERRLKAAEIMAETGLVRRTVQNSLKTLTDSGLLQRLGSGPATRYQLVF